MAEFPSVSHVAVTVTDLSVSVPWYQRLFGVAPALDEDVPGGLHHTVFPLAGGMQFGLVTHPETTGDHAFNECRAGMDHVGFACTSRDELLVWQAKLEELGIAHGEIVDAHFGSGLAFRDPDNIALEFFAPPTQ
jgi:catechol 2,3-dioxygenase-like lactoylglutathione lyase family enzyme